MTQAPFHHAAEIKDRAGDVLAECMASIWPSGQNPDSAAESYDYGGRATHEAAAALIGQQNRVLSVQGTEYNVVEATFYRYLNYVGLRLRRSLPNG